MLADGHERVQKYYKLTLKIENVSDDELSSDISDDEEIDETVDLTELDDMIDLFEHDKSYVMKKKQNIGKKLLNHFKIK